MHQKGHFFAPQTLNYAFFSHKSACLCTKMIHSVWRCTFSGLLHEHGGTVYSSVAQAWHAAMADAKVEDTVLVCGSFHTVAQVMEEIDAGRIGGE